MSFLHQRNTRTSRYLLLITISLSASISLLYSAIKYSSCRNLKQHVSNIWRTGSLVVNSSPEDLCLANDKLPALEEPPSSLPNMIMSYFNTHARVRAMYDRVSSDGLTEAIPPVLIWQVNGNGLGDRIRGIRFALLLAIISNRTFFIDWPPKLYPLTAGAVPRYFDWTLPSSLQSRLSSQSSHSNGMFHFLNWTVGFDGSNASIGQNGQYVDLSRDPFSFMENLPPIVTLQVSIGQIVIKKMLNNSHFPPSLLPPITPDDHLDRRSVFNKNLHFITFTISRLILAPSALTKARLRERNIPQDYTAMHLRIGNDVGERDDNRFAKLQSVPPYDLVLAMTKCALRLRNGEALKTERVIDTKEERESGPVPAIVYATDSKTHKEQFVNAAKKLGAKAIFGTSPTLHIDAEMLSQREIDQLRSKEKCDSFLEIFVDLFALAYAKGLVLSVSGFSYSALFMGNIARVGTIHIARNKSVVCNIYNAEASFV